MQIDTPAPPTKQRQIHTTAQIAPDSCLEIAVMLCLVYEYHSYAEDSQRPSILIMA